MLERCHSHPAQPRLGLPQLWVSQTLWSNPQVLVRQNFTLRRQLCLSRNRGRGSPVEAALRLQRQPGGW